MELSFEVSFFVICKLRAKKFKKTSVDNAEVNSTEVNFIDYTLLQICNTEPDLRNILRFHL